MKKQEQQLDALTPLQVKCIELIEKVKEFEETCVSKIVYGKEMNKLKQESEKVLEKHNKDIEKIK